MSRVKDLYMAEQERLAAEFMELHPDVDEWEAWEAVADEAWHATADRYADMADHYCDMAKESGL